MNDYEWVVAVLFLSMLGAWYIVYSSRKEWSKHGYDEGFRTCTKYYNYKDEVSDDEKALLKEMKEAVRKQLITSGIQKRGDIKAINETRSMKELEAIAWKLLVLRREQGE